MKTSASRQMFHELSTSPSATERTRSDSIRRFIPNLQQGSRSTTPLEELIREYIGDLTLFLRERQLELQPSDQPYCSSRESLKSLCASLISRSASIDDSLFSSPASTGILLAYSRAKLLFDSLRAGVERHLESPPLRERCISPLSTSGATPQIARVQDRPEKQPCTITPHISFLQTKLQELETFSPPGSPGSSPSSQKRSPRGLIEKIRSRSMGASQQRALSNVPQQLAQLDQAIVEVLMSSLENFEKLTLHAERWKALQKSLDFIKRDLTSSPLTPYIEASLQNAQTNIDIGNELSTTFAESLSLLREIEIDLEKTNTESKEGLRSLLSACSKFHNVQRMLDSLPKERPAISFQKAQAFTQISLKILYASLNSRFSGVTIDQEEREQALSFWAGRSYDRGTLTRFFLKALSRFTFVNDDLNLRALLDGCLLQLGSESKEWRDITSLYDEAFPTTDEWTGYIQRVQDLLNDIRKTLENPNVLANIKDFHLREEEARTLEVELRSQGIRDGIPIAEIFSQVHLHLKQQSLFPYTQKELELKTDILEKKQPKCSREIILTVIAKTIVHALYSSDEAESECATNEGNLLLNCLNPATLTEIKTLIGAFALTQLKKAGDAMRIDKVRGSMAAASLPTWISPLKSSSQVLLTYDPETLFSSSSMMAVDCKQLERSIEALIQEDTILWKVVVEIYRAILRAKNMLLTQPNDTVRSSLEGMVRKLTSICTENSLLSNESLQLAESLIANNRRDGRTAKILSRRSLAIATILQRNEKDIALQRTYNILFPLLIEKALGVTTHEEILAQLPEIFQQLCIRDDLKKSIFENNSIGDLVVLLLGPQISDKCSDIKALKAGSDQILENAKSKCPCYFEIVNRSLKQTWQKIVNKNPRFSQYPSKLQTLSKNLSTSEFSDLCKNLKEFESILASLAKFNSFLPTGFYVQEFIVSKSTEDSMEQAFRRCLDSPQAQQFISKGQQQVQMLVDELNNDLTNQFEIAQHKLKSPDFKNRLRKLIGNELPDRLANELLIKFFEIDDRFLHISSLLKGKDAQSFAMSDSASLKTLVSQYYLRLLILFSGQTLSSAHDISSAPNIHGRWSAFSSTLSKFQDDPLITCYAKTYTLLCLRPKSDTTNLNELTEAYVSHVNLIINKLVELFFMQAKDKNFTNILNHFLRSFERLCLTTLRDGEYTLNVSLIYSHFTKAQLALQEAPPEALKNAQRNFYEQPVNSSLSLKAALAALHSSLLKKGPSLQENIFMVNLSETMLPALINELSTLSKHYQHDKETRVWIVNVVGRLSQSIKEFLTVSATESHRAPLLETFFQLEALSKDLGSGLRS